MGLPLRILLLEDDEADAQLVLRELRRGGLEFAAERVDTAEGLAAALGKGPWHAIISDYALPGFTVMDALQVLRDQGLDLPFLIVSGTIGEAVAVEAMRAGAHDYLRKDDLARLVPAVKREVREAAHRRQRELAERELAQTAEMRKRYEFIVNSSHDFMTLINREYVYEAANEAYCRAMSRRQDQVVGRTVAEIWGRRVFDEIVRGKLDECLAGKDVTYAEWFEFGPLGRRYCHVCCYPYRGRGKVVTHAVVVSRDITERELMREELDRLLQSAESRLEEMEKLQRLQDDIIGETSVMQRLRDTIREVAQVDAPVLVQGESGTGKELVAKAIRHAGARAKAPFVAVNCGALPEGVLESELFGHVRGAFTGAVRDRKGRFELAHEGTIFLDEVGELSPATQVKLLRVLQEGEIQPVGSEKTVHVDVRVISATNKDLRQEVAAGRFREDLFYRLAVVPIEVPPLRDRREDIPRLASHILRKLAAENRRDCTAPSPEALEALMGHDWPGNVRELENALQYALVKCRGGELEAAHLPPGIRDARQGASASAATGRPRRKLNAESVRRALEEAEGNKVKAAELLGVARATLYRFLSDFDLAGQ